MEIFDSLIEKWTELKKTIKHKSYYHWGYDSKTIVICDMLICLQNIYDIYDWHMRNQYEIFYEHFGIYRIQFYNLISCGQT